MGKGHDADAEETEDHEESEMRQVWPVSGSLPSQMRLLLPLRCL